MTVFEVLREETRAHHTAAESAAGLPAARAELIRQLRAFRAFYAAWEPWAVTAAPAGVAWSGAWRVEALDADLAALDAPVPRETTPAPTFSDNPAVIGSLYVVEGSALGGQVIAAHLERVLGVKGGGATFFRGAGAQTMPRWRAFKESAAPLVPPDGHAAAVAGARATFDAIGAALRAHWA
ncbi:MAG TPA: biliverdin-producing heme oxygenase [Phycisphaerales bacterium]|nr:biliverdin-producing heme oxygenase [Phycisphaerales bacterium]